MESKDLNGAYTLTKAHALALCDEFEVYNVIYDGFENNLIRNKSLCLLEAYLILHHIAYTDEA